MKKAPLIVITGPTASGKSALAFEMAKKYGGEIVCADSRTIYKDMDIGTAKPSLAEQKQVKHWLLDVAQPGQRFTAVDFKKLAEQAITDIWKRGKIPFLVGGTGLYIDAVILDFKFGAKVDQARRKELNDLSIEELQTMIKRLHLTPPENSKNKRYLVRCVEKNNDITSGKNQPDEGTYVLAVELEKKQLEGKIAQRIDKMFADGVVQETQQLVRKYGFDSEALTGNIYRTVIQYLAGSMSEEQAKAQALKRDLNLVKRQVTWLKRHDFVKWLSLDDAKQMIEDILKKS